MLNLVYYVWLYYNWLLCSIVSVLSCMTVCCVAVAVRTCVGRSVCPVHCGKTADRIQMPFGIIGRTGPGMRPVVECGDRCTGRGTFGGEFGTCHCNQWKIYGVCVRQRRDAALFPNYFGKTCSLTLGRYDPKGILTITDNTKMDTNNQLVQSKAGKLS